MKKLINTTGMFLLCLLFASPLKAQVRYATLSIKGASNMPYVIASISEQYGIHIINDTIKIKAGQTVNHMVKIKNQQLINLNYDSKTLAQLWLKPGDKLFIDLQREKPEFQGVASAFPKYYISANELLIKEILESKQRNPNYKEEANAYSNAYFKMQDSITKEQISFLKNYFTGVASKDAQAFVRYQTIALIYKSLYYKLMFNSADPEKFKFYQEKYHVSRPFSYEFSEVPEFKNTSLLSNDLYQMFLYAMVRTIAEKRVKDRGEKYNFGKNMELAMQIIDELTEGAGTAIALKSIFLNQAEMPIAYEKNQALASKVITLVDAIPGAATNASLQLVRQKANKVLLETKFNKGVKAPAFTFADVARKTYTPDDFKGKKIYIDMGASWCGPCIASIPAWNKLVEANKGNDNIVFISLSLDNIESEWKTFLTEHAISGMRLHAEGGFKSNFAVDYNISNVPHFMLIDEDGKMVAYTAPSPDSREIISLLQKK